MATTRTEEGHKQNTKTSITIWTKGRRNFVRPKKSWRDKLHFEDQGTGNTPNTSGTWWLWWWWNLKPLIPLMKAFCLRVVYKITKHRVITYVFGEHPGWRAWRRFRLASVNQTDGMILQDMLLRFISVPCVWNRWKNGSRSALWV